MRCELGRPSVGDRCGRGRSLRLESFREERRDHAGKDVAGARSGERRRPEVADDDACAGCSDDRVRALEQHDGAESINRLLRRGEPVRADPVRVDAEEASELAGVRRENRRRSSIEGFEVEERIGINHRGKLQAFEQLTNEQLAVLTATETWPEGD